MKLTTNDYLNLALFFVMSTLVTLSYFHSAFYSDPSLQGHVVRELGTSTFSYNASPEIGGDTLYTGDNILFHVTITKDGVAVNNIACKISIGIMPTADMQYISLAGYYGFTTKFNVEGIYQYIIKCDLSNIGEQNITVTDTASIQKKLPDYTISLTAPTKAVINSETSFNVSITNIGVSTSANDVVFKISYGDGTEEIQTRSIAASPVTYTFLHTYTTNGTYKVNASVDSNNAYQETLESNNNAIDFIPVTEITDTSNICGNLDKSASLNTDLYCQDGVTITAEIQLDCNGHRVYGDGVTNQKTGITINAKSSVKNCFIDGYTKGIEANVPATIQKNTIRNTDTALILKSAGNTVTNNTFADSSYGILNSLERFIQYNNFVNLVVYNINTSVSADLSKNYFGTTSYSRILQLIKNSTPITVDSYYDRSTNEAQAKLISVDKSGPAISVKISLDNRPTETRVTFAVLTDEKSDCRYGIKSTDTYDTMEDMDDDSDNNHTTMLIYYDKESITLYFQCEDQFNNPSAIYKSDEIVTQMPTEYAMNQIENLSVDNKEQLDNYKQRKLDLEDSLKKATNDVTKNDIQGDINRTIVDIEYYDHLYKNNIATRDALKKIKDKVDSIRNSILENDQKIDLIKSNLTLITEEIDNKTENDSTSVDISLEKKFNYLEDLYLYLDQNLTKQKDRLSLRNDYVIKVLDMERLALVAKKSKYEKLMTIDNIGYKDIIQDIDSQYEDKDVKIKEEGDEQAIADLDNEIDMLKEIISLKEDLLDQLDSLERIVSDRSDYAASKNNNILEQELNRIGRDISIKQDETNKLIDELENELNAKTFERSNFKRYYERIVTYDELVISGMETSVVPNSTMNLAWILIAYKGTLLKNLSMEYASQIGPNTHFNVSFIGNKIDSSDKNVVFLEWFMVNNTNDTKIKTLSINLSIDKTKLKKLNSNNSELACYKVSAEPPGIVNSTIQGSMIMLNTTKSEDGEEVIFHCQDNSAGFYAIGYVNGSKPVVNKTAKCVPEWIPNAFTECDDSRQKSRNLQDRNRCDKSNLTYTEKVNCTDAEINCKNGAKDEGEDGIDCGLICDKACNAATPTQETPKPVEEVTEIPKTRNFLKDAIVVLILSTIIIGGAIFKFKMKGKSFGKKSGAGAMQKHDIELIDALAKKVFNYQETTQVEAEFIVKKRTKEQIDFYNQIIKYILKKLEMNPKTQYIINDLVAAKWTESDAKAIVEHVAAKFVGYHIEEFGNMFSSEEEKRETMLEMLGSEGFEAHIIDLALKMGSRPLGKAK